MRCLLLAAGLGTRLRPLTLRTPKCLIEVRGRPLLQWWLEHLEKHGCDEVRMNTHHLADQVDAFVRDHTGPLRLQTVYEPELLGSAGTLRANRDFFPANEPVLVAYADNLTNADLGSLWREHAAGGRPLTMGLFQPKDPRGTGLVELAADGCIVGFEEKPAHPRGTWANAGLYVMEGQVVDALTTPDPADIARDLVPRWLGRATGVPVRGYLRDIGTPAAYAAAQEEWPE